MYQSLPCKEGPENPLALTLARTLAVGMQADYVDGQCPLEYFLLKHEKQAPREDEASGTAQNL